MFRTCRPQPAKLDLVVSMKLAISGKGGTGKSTLAAALALLLTRQGRQVLALDADPDGNLAAALGAALDVQKSIVPIAQHKALIEERTGAKVKQYGQIFKLNPEVSDIAARYGTNIKGVSLLVLGAIESGGSGCACPESILIRALVTDLVLYHNEVLIMDMEAGIEHLGRATARGVDTLIVMVEPSQRALDSAQRVIRLAREIGLTDIRLVANKISSPDDEEYLHTRLPDQVFLGSIPWSEEIRLAEKQGASVLDHTGPQLMSCFQSILNNLNEKGRAAL